MLFMLFYYKLSGVNAIVALVFNLVILLGLMAYIGATMTLPGIAGFVLTMGVGVDSNVLIFERIKEELAAQRGVRAVDQRRLQPRVPDAARHARRVADLGGVPVPVRHRPDPRLRDDAVDRALRQPVHLDLRVEDAVRARAVRSARTPRRSASERQTLIMTMHIFKNPNFDFVRWKWHAIALSWIIILAGAVVIWTKGMPKGVEFSGGTIVIVKFEQPPDLDKIRARRCPAAARTRSCSSTASRRRKQVMIRVHTAGAESGGSLSATRRRRGQRAATRPASARSAAPARRRSRQLRRRTEIVGPTVGEELQTRGILATIFALGGILVYIALRFQLSFAVGAVVATIHDLLITLAFLGVLPLRPEPERHRRDPDDHRLLDERHDRHLRPRPREHALDAPRQHRQRSSTPRSTRCSTGR